MQVMAPFVASQLVRSSIKVEAATGDAVRVAADDRAKVGVPGCEIASECREAEDDVGNPPFTVRDSQCLNNATMSALRARRSG